MGFISIPVLIVLLAIISAVATLLIVCAAILAARADAHRERKVDRHGE